MHPLGIAFFGLALYRGSLGHKPDWVSELGVLGTCPSDGSLKSWGPSFCGVQTLHSLKRIWELGVPSQLYGTVLKVGFMV